MKLHSFNGYVQELQKVVTLDNNPVLEHLDHINSLLHNALLTCRAAITVPAEQTKKKSLINKEYIAPGQNLQHQHRSFPKTTQLSGRKRNGLVLK